ncbi:tyrosine-type recombinase/integrase [Croceimicrobium sp.]|uniref:tyrosine-type recombinase/integrase n=1 Tax=Croceimicrobium sp. TaxID=2828340 RepID=UPI003BA8F859
MKADFEYHERFRAYLQSKGLSSSSQKAYSYSVGKFLSWYKADLASCQKRDIMEYLGFLKEKKQSNASRQWHLYALCHFFDFLFQEGVVAGLPTRGIHLRGVKTRKIPRVYTEWELEQIYDQYYYHYVQGYDDNHIPKNQREFSRLSRERNYIMLGLLIYQGLVPREFNRLRIEDIDIAKAKVKIHGRTRATDRRLLLEATQVGALMRYLMEVRPQFLNYNQDSDRVFLALPPSGKQKSESQNLGEASRHLATQLKKIRPDFQNLRQLRASRIVAWLSTEGLRRTQYLAGHKSIVSTEEYLAGDMEQLSQDIERFNPF